MRKWLVAILVGVFLGAFALQIYAAKSDSQTTDEAIHLVAGYTYLTKGDFRLDPEHPPLIKELSALPLLLANLRTDFTSMWDNAGNYYYDSWQEARVLGEKLLYGWGNDAGKVLLLGRLVPILLTLILGFFAFFWAKKLYGEKAGVLAAFLVLFFPNILSHGHLINTDLGLTLFTLIAVYFWGKFLKHINIKENWLNLLLAGIFSGLAMASKFTAIILFFILLILAIVKLAQDKKQYATAFFSYLLVLVISFFVVWSTYGFSLQSPPEIKEGLSEKVTFEIRNFNKFYDSFDVFQSENSAEVPSQYNNVYAFVRPVLIPADFFKGFVFVTTHALGGHGSFLLGMNSNDGWWYYFPVAIFFKTPIPIFILFTLAIIYRKKLSAKDNFDELLLIMPPAIYLTLAMVSKADLGIRHILPIFPFIFIYISKTINIFHFSRKNWLKVIVAVSVVWYLVSALISFPDYLSYFNEFALGPKNGHKILTDSNLDWGQDIYRVKTYIDQNNVEVSYMTYPWDGQMALNYYGLNYPELKPDNTNAKGYVIISATYYETNAYKWIKQYPAKQITPGVYLVDIN